MQEHAEICVVGAGISGLLAAKLISEAGRRVLVFDKGRGVGGRMSTRRFGGGIFDHGAQFFTARDARFARLVSEWEAAGVVAEWSAGFEKWDGGTVDQNAPYYRATDGMNGVAKHLATDLDVRTGTRLTQIAWSDGKWHLSSDAALEATADALIMTPPVPQTLDLISDAGFSLAGEDERILRNIRYERCIALLLALAGRSALPPAGGLFAAGEPVSWIADNFAKSISPNVHAVTVHAGPEFSSTHWTTPDAQVAEMLTEASRAWLGAEVLDWQIHRWKYSKPVRVHPERAYRLQAPGAVVLAGDAFGGPRVEGAAMSGLAAAETLLNAIEV